MVQPESGMRREAVVSGYDGSDEARRATLWAAKEAVSRHRALVVVRAEMFPPLPGPYTMGGGVASPQMLATEQEIVRQRAETALGEIAEECRRAYPDLVLSTYLGYGQATDVLGQVADNAHLLVVGASGISGLPKVLLGSTAAGLSQGSRCPVVVVRRAKNDARPDGGRVVVGVDGSSVSAQAVAFAFDFAGRHDCELVALHAWSDLPVDASAPVSAWDEDLDDVQAKGQRLIGESLAGHQEQFPDVRVRHVVVLDRPAHALVDHAEGAELLVVGSHGRGALRRAVLGSVSHAMVYHAPCPVAVVRHDVHR